MNIRQGVAGDAKQIAALIASFQAQLIDRPDGSGAEQYLAAVSESAEETYLNSPRYLYLLAHENERLLGFIAMRDLTHIFHLFVDRQYQRRGIAGSLWQHARYATSQPPTSVFTVNSSLLAVPVYTAWGFQASGPVTRTHGISFLPMRRPSPQDGV